MTGSMFYETKAILKLVLDMSHTYGCSIKKPTKCGFEKERREKGRLR
jgi:hypothetical protein